MSGACATGWHCTNQIYRAFESNFNSLLGIHFVCARDPAHRRPHGVHRPARRPLAGTIRESGRRGLYIDSHIGRTEGTRGPRAIQRATMSVRADAMARRRRREQRAIARIGLRNSAFDLPPMVSSDLGGGSASVGN